MATRINLPCDGDAKTRTIAKIKDTIIFGTDGNCDFTSFAFVPEPPPGFTNRQPPKDGGPTISYDYDGSAIAKTGYPIKYKTDSMVVHGNGTGVIKNS